MPCIYHNNWAKSIVRKIFKFQYTVTNFKHAFKNTVVNMKNIKPAAVFRFITDLCFNVLLLVRFLSKIFPRLENRLGAAHSSDKSEKINQSRPKYQTKANAHTCRIFQGFRNNIGCSRYVLRACQSRGKLRIAQKKWHFHK